MSLVEAATPVDVQGGGYSSSRGAGLRRATLEIANNEELLRSDAEDEDEDEDEDEEASTQSSSIGQPDDDDDDDDDEVQSTLSLGSLEDSLPVKRRGLSNFYAGKSKSFANLTEVRNVNDIKELGKSENPFNKRRRTLMAYNLMFKQDKVLKHKNMFYSHSNHISMPLLPLAEIDDDDDDDTSSFPLQQIQ